jgi:hypothetical protein
MYSDALDNHLGLCILRVREGFDYSSFIDEDSAETLQTLECDDSLSELIINYNK